MDYANAGTGELQAAEERLPWGDAYTRADATGAQKKTAVQKFERFWADLEQEVSAQLEAGRTPAMAAASADSVPARASVLATGAAVAAVVAAGTLRQAGADEPDAGAPEDDDAYDRLVEVLENNPRHRELLWRVLRLCAEPQVFGDVEAAIESYPEYAGAAQPPYRLISYLIDGGGLEQEAIGFDGKPLTPEDVEGLTLDQIDDLTDVFTLRTTEIGKAVAADREPVRRMEELFAAFPDRVEHYLDVMRFCADGDRPRYRDIAAHFEGVDLSGVETLNPEAQVAVKPTVFVDQLERAGAIVYDGGWLVTDEGVQFMEQFATQPTNKSAVQSAAADK